VSIKQPSFFFCPKKQAASGAATKSRRISKDDVKHCASLQETLSSKIAEVYLMLPKV
jgi:hypothetical protein